MLDTTEIRWILRGTLPPPVERWFSDARDLEPQTRTDRYVVLPDCDTVGIKLRGTDSDGPTRLEVKARCGVETALRLAPDVRGRAAAWSKWTLELSGPSAIGAGFERPTPTLSARKRRLVRRYAIGAARPEEVALGEDVDSACDVELTTVAIDGLDASWWSVGFEAFGPPEQVWGTLRAVATSWFEAHGPPPLRLPGRLDGRTSSAYPAWLIRRLAETRGREPAGSEEP